MPTLGIVWRFGKEGRAVPSLERLYVDTRFYFWGCLVVFILIKIMSSLLLNIGILKYRNEDSLWIFFSVKKVS